LESIHQRHLSPAPDPTFDPIAYQKGTERWWKAFQEQVAWIAVTPPD